MDTFDADLQRSEMLRQSNAAAAKTKFDNRSGDEPIATLNAAMQAAQVAHLRRCLASARANGRDEASWLFNLKNIGADA